jgi:hypothetical protein
MATREPQEKVTVTFEGAPVEVSLPKLPRVIAPLNKDFLAHVRAYQKIHKVNETQLTAQALASFTSYPMDEAHPLTPVSTSTPRTPGGKTKEQVKLENKVKANTAKAVKLWMEQHSKEEFAKIEAEIKAKVEREFAESAAASLTSQQANDQVTAAGGTPIKLPK